MMMVLLGLYALCFAGFAFFRFNTALGLFLFLLPSYMIRFSVGPFPSTVLEVMFIILFIIWIFREGPRITYQLTNLFYEERLLFVGIVLFLLAATISVFTGIDIRSALGEWKAFYVEPIIFFLILITSIKTKKELCFVLNGLVFVGLATALLAVYQQFTGWMVPYDFWEKGNSYRVTGWYGFPNGVGLFLAPLIPITYYLFTETARNIQKEPPTWHDYIKAGAYILTICLIPFALFFAKSTGALVGVAAGCVFLLLVHKKTRIITLVLGLVGLISILAIPRLQPIQNELLFQDRSGQIRLAIWKETTQLLFDNPITGAGLASYSEKIEPYHTTVNGEGIEIFHHPHNIFLTMWVNLGLTGLIGFLCILIWFFRKSISAWHFGLGGSTYAKAYILIASSMVILLVHGLVDSPYIKNDLSILFWVLPALLFLIDSTKSQMEV